jgi:hypothetical protein
LATKNKIADKPIGNLQGVTMSTEQNAQTVIDFSTIIPSMPKLEQEVVETSQGETQQTNQEVPIEPLTKVDEPSKEPFDAAKHYQSIADKRLAELEREKVLREQAEAKLQQYIQPKVEVQAPPKLLPRPTRPKDYDETEAITNPDSSSGIFLKADRDYKDSALEVLLYENAQLKSFQGQIETEKVEQLKSKELLAHEAYQLGLIQEAGASDVNEAREVQKDFATPKNDKDFAKDLLEFYRWKKGQVSPQTQSKVEQFNKNSQRQAQYIAPPGVVGSQAVSEEKTFGDLLVETYHKDRRI